MLRQKMMAAILPILLVITTAFAQPAPSVRQTELGQEFDVRAGEHVMVDGLRVEFAGVKEDSRCPVDVTCVWQGNAKVMLQVKARGMRSRAMTLNTGMEPKQSAYGRYEIKLVKLEPKRKKSDRIRGRDYVATLVITKK